MKNVVNKASEGLGYLVNKITGKGDNTTTNTNRFASVSSDECSDYQQLDDNRDSGYKKQSLIDRYNY
jgi:hypothetical protein